MACRFAGLPVPQRPAVSNDHGAHGIAADKQSEGVNGRALAQEAPRFSSVGTQTAPTKTKPPAGNSWWPALSLNSFKRSRVEDADDEDKNSLTPYTHESTLKKRTACVEPAELREADDGRTKRTKLVSEASTTLINATANAASSSTISNEDHGLPAAGSGTIMSRKCSACLDMHPIRDTIQLQCKNTGDAEAHAYCRECLIHLFETCITDSSQFPPRCCNQILPVFACIPYLPPALFARFVAKSEELETPNRTYCSNALCSKWIRPVNIVANIATCTTCIHKTCETCKRGQHEGLCEDDMDVKKLLDVAKEKQWQTCPNCNEMVELKGGCLHITYVPTSVAHLMRSTDFLDAAANTTSATGARRHGVHVIAERMRAALLIHQYPRTLPLQTSSIPQTWHRPYQRSSVHQWRLTMLPSTLQTPLTSYLLSHRLALHQLCMPQYQTLPSFSLNCMSQYSFNPSVSIRSNTILGPMTTSLGDYIGTRALIPNAITVRTRTAGSMAVTLEGVMCGFVGDARSVTIPTPLQPESRLLHFERNTYQAESFSLHVAHR